MKKRALISLPESGRAPRRPLSAILFSTAVHVVAIIGLAHVLAIPTRVARFFETRAREEIPVERVGFVSIRSGVSAVDVAGRSGGDDRPIVRPREEPRLVAPASVPSGIPTPPPDVEPAPITGSGPLVGTGGPTRGVRPAFKDPRLWEEPSPVLTAPRTVRETVEDIIVGDVARISDSLAAARPKREPGDWTFERNGRKYGIDSKFIRLGPVSIPTAVLALLPVNVQANPVALDRERALNYMKADIDYHAQRAISEDEFRRNVRNLRERKERERAGRETGQAAEKETERQENAPAAPRNDRLND